MTSPNSPQDWGQAEQVKTEQAKRRLFVAGQVATWVWVALAVVPIVGLLICCGLCGLGGVVGSVSPDPTFTPYP